MTSLQNRTFSQTPLNIPFTILTERFHVIKSDQRGYNRMCREEAEAAERCLIYNAFKLRVRNVFADLRPPLISMLNASVGYPRKRNFTKELFNEFCLLDMREAYDEVLLPRAFIETSSNLLTDWQNDFHYFMTGSPVLSRTLKAKKGCKKSKNHLKVDAPTYDEIWQTFHEHYRLHIANNLNKFPMFTAQSVKQTSPFSLDLQVNKHFRLLLE
ncbi:hypothetical protein C1645_806131 [Glomus cerebriforme]|uniref:Uncharacterized protein n=1 Tax=Glomus cerebriforme TaxID=658196 RepID=A0A397T089_9GLOM|nr:hypothetical protein C1645_806131 [Glomus cerebriforme]